MGTAFFIISELVGLALQVETWLAIGMCLCLLGGLRARPGLARWSGGLSLIALLIIGALPVGDVLLRPLEAEFPPRTAPMQIDGIVVLGGVEDPRSSAAWGQPQLNESAERLTVAASLALSHPAARLVFAGGSERLGHVVIGQVDAANVATDFFASLGIDPDRVTWEDRSRNTAENARYTYELVGPGPDETWLLITSAFHMGRALASFEAAGWNGIVPHPVDYYTGQFTDGIGWNLAGNLNVLNMAIKEWVGRWAYRALVS